MPTLKELAQLGKEAILASVAQLLTEFAALNARVEKPPAENAALKARLDQQARTRSGKRLPSPRAGAGPGPSPRDVSQARGASPSAPCRLPASGPRPRSSSGCPSRPVPVVANRWRNI